MKYVFQRSKIWEAGNPIDATSAPVRIKVPDGSQEARARRKLPAPGTGRVWVLIDAEILPVKMFCVKCGVDVSATDSECPRCHFDTLVKSPAKKGR